MKKDTTSEDNDLIDYLSIMYEKLVPLLVAGIQELSDKVDALESKLNNG